MKRINNALKILVFIGTMSAGASLFAAWDLADLDPRVVCQKLTEHNQWWVANGGGKTAVVGDPIKTAALSAGCLTVSGMAELEKIFGAEIAKIRTLLGK